MSQFKAEELPAQLTLDDKYERNHGRVYLTGLQALVRLPLMQAARDRAAGLDTGGFISGYRGSPLAGYDLELTRARAFLEAATVHFQPGLNEELAATAVWGSQQVGLFPGALKQGVFALWYGKGPGVDRCGDVFKHANMAGTAAHGGVLAVMGDDHAAESSTLAYQSEQAMIAALSPILNPATLQDYLDFGLYGWAMSRYCGLWVAFKALNDTVASSASVAVDSERVQIHLPTDFEVPSGGLNIRIDGLSHLVGVEERAVSCKLEAARAFARANRLDRIVADTPSARIGVVTAGKSHVDVMQAFEDLGIGGAGLRAAGVRILKVGMTWPLEPRAVEDFSRGLDEILVIEEKRPIVEDQVARILYNRDSQQRPLLTGKTDERGAPLLPSHGELSPSVVAAVLAARLGRRPEAAAVLERCADPYEINGSTAVADLTPRKPYYCSGCPHNVSTRVPEDAVALGGIGCHTMALLMPERRTLTVTQMGGEGANWIGMAPFTTTSHVFQNLGDGTYFHSGLLAVRAAVAAGVNITYKVLYNDAVAMTGGQAVDGPLTVASLTQQLRHEGVAKIVVVADDPRKYPNADGFAAGTTVRHRDAFDEVQDELARCPGVTVLVYDQVCAAERRRKRKRGQVPPPSKRVFINELVCEGCGDCNTASNCVSVEPLETEFGRKRTINQSSCNTDYSCLKGYCPSFVAITGAEPARRGGADIDALRTLPAPEVKISDEPYSILVTGIGGTGIVTVGALLGVAAHLEGKAVTVLDMAGLAQKNGAVMTHVRVGHGAGDGSSVRIPKGKADLVIACDMLVAAGHEALARMSSERTSVLVNSHFAATGDFQTDPDADFRTAEQRTVIERAVGADRTTFFDATKYAAALMGDAIAANVFLLGYASQKGLLPVAPESLERAIRLNAVSVESNLKALAFGRLGAVDPETVRAIAAPAFAEDPEFKPAEDVDAVVSVRAAFLRGYQNDAYASGYRAFVEQVARVEVDKAAGCAGLAEAVAKSLFKLMAYKDEYEVARLFTDGGFDDKIANGFSGKPRVRYHFAPQFMPIDPRTRRPRKVEFGAWIRPLLRAMAALRFLRGTPFDPFGYMKERRTAREILFAYKETILVVSAGLNPTNHALAVAIAEVPMKIRGFGAVKDGAVRAARARERALLREFEQATIRTS